jgi:opacity protein-like surface antigen
MTSRLGFLAAVSTVALAVGAADAARAQVFGGGGFYVKGFGGATFPQNDDFQLNSRTGPGSTGSGLDFDTGYTLGIAAGYDFTPNLAVEIEYAYRNADATVSGTGGEGGQTESNAWMVNGIYTFDGFGPNGAWQPYAGAGIGAADLNVEAGNLGGDFDSDYNFAYQLITGVAYDVNPNFTLMGEVRFFGINDQDLENDALSFKSTYQTFDLLVGAAYHF